MSTTFEALIKAEKEKRIKPGELKAFHQKARAGSKGPITFRASLPVVEEYHRMKHQLLNWNPEVKERALLFFSSAEGEGTSTALLNFALTLASEGANVLLVDANLRNPSLHQALEVAQANGLTELLQGKTALSQVTKNTGIEHLALITSGNPPANPSSLFEAEALKTLVAQMKSQADWVLFDSPALNAYNDTVVLAPNLDGAIMILQSESTRWEVAQNAKQRMENGRGIIIGTILNRRKIYIPQWIYDLL